MKSWTRPFCIVIFLVSLASPDLCAQIKDPDSLKENRKGIRMENWSVHFQQTVVTQYQPGMKSPYAGLASFSGSEEAATSLTATFFLGRRLWKGAAIFFNPELAGGSGLSRAQGIAGFVNGETFRVGDPKPQAYVARIFFQQIWGLKKAESEKISNDVNEFSRSLPNRRIVLTTGKFSLADIFDNNTYSHDPRTQFLNWSNMSAGAWDFAANIRGYTWGITLSLILPRWALRTAFSLVPEYANGPYLETRVDKAHALALEGQYSWSTGALRLTVFYNNARAGNYRQATEMAPFPVPDIIATRAWGRVKYGFVFGLEQKIGKSGGLFARLSWNDGQNETWAFTEIDHSLSAGTLWTGEKWKRPEDKAGLAFVANGISIPHRNYLRAGGVGFMIGDGQLPNYNFEMITEIFYAIHLHGNHFYLTPNFQVVFNPAYNPDRGPAFLAGLRFHTRF